MSWGTWWLGSSLKCVTMSQLNHHFNHSQVNILHSDQQTGRLGPSRHCSWQLLWKTPEPHIFETRVFSPFAQSPKYFPQSVLQEKWAGEEKSIWSACQRSGAWSFFSTSGGMGPTANVVYKRISSIMIAQKTFSKTLHCIRCKLSYVPKRSKIQHSPPYNIPRHNGPSLPQRLGLSTLNWTHIHSNPLYILYTFCISILIDWISMVKKK